MASSNWLGKFAMLMMLGAAVALPACGGTEGGDDPDAGIIDEPPDVPYPDAPAILEIYGLDVWGQYLPDNGGTLSVRRDGAGDDVAVETFPVARIGLTDPGTYRITLSAPDHFDLTLAIDFDGSSTLAGLVVREEPGPGDGLSVTHEMRDIVAGQDAKPVHTLYLGVRHKWFSSLGRPARRGNRIELLMDGEQAWGRVAGDLENATDKINVSTWWWESQFELLRDKATHIGLSASEREKNTIMNILERSPATKRVLVGQFLGQDGLLSWLTVDSALRSKGSTGGDNFEFMGMANLTSGSFWFEPGTFEFGDRVRTQHTHTQARVFEDEAELSSLLITPRQVDLTQWPIGVTLEHASYHQKFMTIDDEIAFIGGMNLRRVDWDSSDHEVFDYRRMLFDASVGERNDVKDKDELADMGPRKDYMLRIEGPSAQDAADVFKARWDFQRSEAATYSDKSSAFEVGRNVQPFVGGSQVQVTVTLPDPFWEHSIAETWIAAIENAEKFIYIEDQYFRMPMVNDHIIARMNKVPGLQLVVITKPVDEWTDPGCEWTHITHQEFKAAFPTRYHMFQLRAFDYAVTWGFDETQSYFPNIDTHSKMLIVDDKFMSVGSANKNNRGIVYEGEMNAAVFDPIFVKEQRRRILANILPVGVVPSDNSDVWIEDLDQAASWNDSVWDNWEEEGTDISLDGAPLPQMYDPDGFIYTLEFRTPDDCFIEGVGPDMT